MEVGGFDAVAGLRERGGEDHRVAESERVGGVGFFGRYVDPIIDGERLGIEPSAIGEERVAAEVGDGGFEVQAAGYGNRDDCVAVRGEDRGELANTLGVRAAGEADEKSAIDAEDVAAFQRARWRDVFELAEFGESFRERGCFGAARFGAEREHHGEFVENDGGVFDEHRVRKIGLGGERDDAGAEFLKKVFVGAMLAAGLCKIDRLALNEGQLAVHDSGTDGARDGGEHVRGKSLHGKNQECFLRG